jgi:pilus assembly protein Flp/PilA
MRRFLTRLFRDEHGATAVEYGLILAMVFIVSMVAIKGFASESIKMWNNSSTAVAQAGG